MTKDAEVSYSGTGTAVCKFSIASNGYKDDVSYFNCVAFGKLAENLGKYLTKGKQVSIDGKLKQDRWQDSEGHNRSSVNIVAENIQLLGGNKGNSFEEDKIPFADIPI